MPHFVEREGEKKTREREEMRDEANVPKRDAHHCTVRKRGRDGQLRWQVRVTLPTTRETVTAAGVLLWYEDEPNGDDDDGRVWTLLLRERDHFLGDVGGKVEPEDVCEGDPLGTLACTVRREFQEETGVCADDELRSVSSQPCRRFRHSKYVTFVQRTCAERAREIVRQSRGTLVAVPAHPRAFQGLVHCAAELRAQIHPRLRPPFADEEAA